MKKYYALPGGWYDSNTEIKLYWKVPFINCGYWGGLRTCEFPLSEGVPFGEKYWSVNFCSFNNFYSKEN